MAHCVSEKAEAILDKEFKVLDKGFVRLVDYMGTDDRIVQSARVSYGEGTKTIREDKGLINYLMRHRHTSPFEQVIFTFHIKCPIFVARQWVRHRTARMNEISGRYSVMKDEFFVPDELRTQSKVNKQSSEESTIDFNEVIKQMELEQVTSYKNYEGYIEGEVARELARINLPLSLYTEFYWQMDLHNLLHFLGLRLDSHAQKEIRGYGEVIKDMVKAVAPYTWEAYEDYIINSVRFTKKQIVSISKLFEGLDEEKINALMEKSDLGTSEKAEVKEKLHKIANYIMET